ncbi:conserved hypothetical protein [Uncinocarpus reesii 1704]|uniref:Ubiquitin thioesterase OTU n=1 Tax=Uncinocarpus reesii (strain UAMH 1704) TaxID=336963 RepID=C4JWN0_UNCRE|nr:uncharacterized protein UREG_06972 [Uncinocarpus reesii 1704]EEP82107.1 conserved hypothetical protein [Uncinocarpus reesii 1704]
MIRAGPGDFRVASNSRSRGLLQREMRVRIRGPSGQSTVSLQDTATVGDLLDQIKAKTALAGFDIKYGYPPRSLSLDQINRSTAITEIGVDLNGEQLIIIPKAGASSTEPPPVFAQPAPKTAVESERQPGLLSLDRKKPNIENDPPEIPSADHNGTIVLRIMPDDNSCLFRAVGSAVLGVMDAMTELRSIVAQTIQQQPDTYSQAVLERNRDDYCRWIQSPEAWGGGIELSIFSKHFDIEICSIDVQTLRVDRFNEGRPTRCIVVYSGIHYDTIALSPSDPPFDHAYAPPEFDTKIFDSADPVVLEKAVELCRILQQKHYYTDTAGFQVKCNVCGGMFVGERGATRHAAETGHYDFGEAG